MSASENISLYIHIPWCIKKCPYCDFNSHALKKGSDQPSEDIYVNKLLEDLDQDLTRYHINPTLKSIFIGGGTPSLFSPHAIKKLTDGVRERILFTSDIEITMEANPGTLEQKNFEGYIKAGINRLSIGCQSFQDPFLKKLGRIHNSHEAINAINHAKKSGFENINLDIMFGLPEQTLQEAMTDLETAIKLNPTHISWYQLTLEPNTLFHHKPPTLPSSDRLWAMQTAGQELLLKSGYLQYEVSAYSKKGMQCLHNRNYWEFGDYLGIGAGAHSKITTFKNRDIHNQEKTIIRLLKHKHPEIYMNANIETNDNAFIIKKEDVPNNAIIFEFMLNALRLQEPISKTLFQSKTGLAFQTVEPILQQAVSRELLVFKNNEFYPSQLGQRFLNDLIEMFL